jgi:hypothetical protein
MPQRWPDGSPRTPVSRCPHCGYRMDAVSQIGVERPPRPEPGDLTVCFGCGEALQFGPRLAMQKITAAQLAALEPDEAAELQRMQVVVRAFLAQQS